MRRSRADLPSALDARAIGTAALVLGLTGWLVACAPRLATPGPGTASPAALVASASPSPSASIAPTSPPRFALTKTFTSPLMDYSIKVADDWTVTPATEAWVGTTNNEGAVVDAISPTRTDTTVTIASQPLPAGTTYDAWLHQFHDEVVAGEPKGCDGGDPSTWPGVPIGPETGTFEQLCNAAVAFAEVGGRIYVFAWESDTFNGEQHLRPPEFRTLLSTVTFDPAAG